MVSRRPGDSAATSTRRPEPSRNAFSAGTEIPIVRENDFKNRIVFLNVPSDSRFRVALRIYAHPGTNPLFVPVRIFRMNGEQFRCTQHCQVWPGC